MATQPDDLTPPHHRADGGFQRPWPLDTRPGENGSFWRWQRERRRNGIPPNPPPTALPLVVPSPVQPRAESNALTLTWVGHATFLVQIGAMNLLTDPHFSRRASPVQWAGPLRMTGLPMGIAELPEIDAVLLSHDHYDHLDRGSVRKLARRFPGAVWITPLKYTAWLRRQGVRHVVEADWGEAREVGSVTATCVPVQHWTRRGFAANERLWSGWVIEAAQRTVFFAGDSGYFDGFRDIGGHHGPFDVSLIPIGAYEPRWFMRSSHMNPEEAVQVYQDLGGRGVMAGMHWGTFRLTDEDPLEPPTRTRQAWSAAALDPDGLWIPKHGETRVVAPVGSLGEVAGS